MNGVFITGRLTREVELRHTNDGIAVTTFCIAVDRQRSKDKSEADFVDCVAWRNTAEFISKYFKKGDGIEIQGHLSTRRYEDKNGNNRKITEVVCENANFPKSRARANEVSESSDSGLIPPTPPEFEDYEDDENPFR